jgi:hypothetical protein
MINVKDGSIIIDDQFVLSPKLSFEDFKKSCYYNNQNENRMFYLEGVHEVNNNKFYISLYFNKKFLQSVHIIIDDTELSKNDEMLRKCVHDDLLLKNNIESGKEYSWGEITSVYEPRGDISLIVVNYT